jgi:hypothetical protein
MREVLLVLGLVAGAFGLRTFGHPWLRKAGALLLLAASYVAAWALTGSHLAGMLAVGAWFFLPWLEILTRVRRLRLPLDRALKPTFPPSPERFPQLPEMTEELEAEGFERVDDTSFEWEGTRQFMRLFYHPAERTQAAISLLEQGEMALAWVSLASRTPDDRTWTTWNYPFSQTMKLPPEARLQAVLEAGSFAGLLDEHRGFLGEFALTPDDLAAPDPDAISELIRRETRRQVDHNLDQGLIKLSGDGTFCYSWRGYLFLWRQFLRDMVRLS